MQRDIASTALANGIPSRIPLDDVMASLPADRQQRIRARGVDLIADVTAKGDELARIRGRALERTAAVVSDRGEWG